MSDRGCARCGDQTQGMNANGLCDECFDSDVDQANPPFRCDCDYCSCPFEVSDPGEVCADCAAGVHVG